MNPLLSSALLLDESLNDAVQDAAEGIGDDHTLNTWARVYVHGVIAFVGLAAIGYAVTRLVPIFDVTGNRSVAVALSVIAILAGPPILGSIMLFGILPLLGKRKGWRGLLAWDDRLLAEVSAAKRNAQIVIINWPSRDVRTMGVWTSTFIDKTSNRELATVYVPTAPQTKLGYIRVVAVDDLEVTDWTLKQWQLYQFTFGAVTPDRAATEANNS